MEPDEIEQICKDCQCEHFIVWNCGWGTDLTSCKLQGQSEYIAQVAPNCPHKQVFKQAEEQILKEMEEEQ